MKHDLPAARCIRNGHSILIENVEEVPFGVRFVWLPMAFLKQVLDPALEPVLTKALFKRGGSAAQFGWSCVRQLGNTPVCSQKHARQLLLRLGTEDVPYDESFAAPSTRSSCP